MSSININYMTFSELTLDIVGLLWSNYYSILPVCVKYLNHEKN